MPQWFGLDWTDILIGTALLAIVPFLFAAYGGHLATEALDDPRRKRSIKLQFWGLFSIGIALGFWQQVRSSEADLGRQTKSEWNEIFTHVSPRIWVPSVETTAEAARKSGPDFTITEPRALINMNREFNASLPIWVRYASGHGDSISPVAVALYLDITSHLPRQDKIQDYSAAVQTRQCGWTYLSPIRMRSTKPYWMASVLQARPMDFTGNGLEYKFENYIPAYGTVSGWLFFDSRVKCQISLGQPVRYRITFHTFGGKTFDKESPSTVLSNTSIIPGISKANMTGPTFALLPGLEDLSKAYVKFYSDESDSPYLRQP
ncbi:MAG: hypothetical protein WCA49_21315 [Candidatus Sulfotelmatobacter sp.]